METVTIQKFIRTSPRKLRLAADLVRNMVPSEAVNVLNFTPKTAARDLRFAINVALANAKQQGLDIAKIGFKSLEINEGPKLRRFRAASRGRVSPYKRRMSHIKIVLSDELSSIRQPSQAWRQLADKNQKGIKTPSANTKPEKLTADQRKKGGKQIEVVVDDLANKAK